MKITAVDLEEVKREEGGAQDSSILEGMVWEKWGRDETWNMLVCFSCAKDYTARTVYPHKRRHVNILVPHNL